MAEGSPKLENLSSPRFDISDFLRTPTDGSPDDEHKYSLSALNLPLPTVDVLSSLPPLVSKAHSDHDHDFGSLMFDAQGADDDSAFLSPSLHAEFISFDDIANDSFSVFGESHYDDLVGPSPFSSSAPPCPLAGSNLPSLSFPPHSQFMLPESYVESEPGGQLEMGEYAIPTAENMASTSAGPGSFFTSNQLDWVQEGIGSHHTSIVQQSASQCDSCQLLRCIIHSNGVQETKLEIHGCDGQSYHAVLQTCFCIDDGFPSTFEQQMFEFPVGNAEYVKQFLLQYSLLRRKEGFVLRHDSLQLSSDFGSEINVVSNRASGGAAGFS